MSQNFETAIRSVFEESAAGRIHFGQVIGELMAAHVESYDVDYRTGRITCYRNDDTVVETGSNVAAKQIGQTFDADALKGAIRGAQEGRVKFPEFQVLSQHAGCVGYTVWIAGRHVTYFGRRGETHVEHFPS